MKNLTQLLAGVVVVTGLAACVKPVNPEIKRACTTQTPAQHSDYVEVPPQVDYNNIRWDSAYFKAIDRGTANNDGALSLLYLRFESSCNDDKKTRAIRVLSNDEVNSLGIATRTDLADYLKLRANQSSGYLGPNLLL